MDNIFLSEKLKPDMIIKNWDILYKLYVANNEDVQLSGYTDYNNSLRHFIKFGYKENRSFGVELNSSTLINLRKNKIIKNSIFTSSNDNHLLQTNNYKPHVQEFKKDLSNFEKNYIIQTNKVKEPIQMPDKSIEKNNILEESDILNDISHHKFVDLLEYNENDFTIEQTKLLSPNEENLSNSGKLSNLEELQNSEDLLISENLFISVNSNNSTNLTSSTNSTLSDDDNDEKSPSSIKIIEEFKN